MLAFGLDAEFDPLFFLVAEAQFDGCGGLALPVSHLRLEIIDLGSGGLEQPFQAFLLKVGGFERGSVSAPCRTRASPPPGAAS